MLRKAALLHRFLINTRQIKNQLMQLSLKDFVSAANGLKLFNKKNMTIGF